VYWIAAIITTNSADFAIFIFLIEVFMTFAIIGCFATLDAHFLSLEVVIILVVVIIGHGAILSFSWELSG
jgi:hypothetical protein